MLLAVISILILFFLFLYYHGEKCETQQELIDSNEETCNRLRSENVQLLQDARYVYNKWRFVTPSFILCLSHTHVCGRLSTAMRDEIDILKEKVRKTEKLESEVQRYRDKVQLCPI